MEGYRPGQPKVGDLYDIPFAHETVPRSEVTMDVVMHLQIGHPWAYLLVTSDGAQLVTRVQFDEIIVLRNLNSMKSTHRILRTCVHLRHSRGWNSSTSARIFCVSNHPRHNYTGKHEMFSEVCRGTWMHISSRTCAFCANRRVSCLLRWLSREPNRMYSATIKMGRCFEHTPNNCTRFGCWSFLLIEKSNASLKSMTPRRYSSC